MKKLFLLVLVFCSLKGFCQYPVLQTIGSDSTLVTSKGAFKSRLINFPFTDTIQANTNRIKFYDGAQIYTKSGGAKFWIRDSTLNKWVQFQAGAATAFVDSITLSSSQTTDTLKYWKAGTGTTVGYIDRPDGLIQGGIVTWSGTGLIYDITSAIYWIDNVRYTSAAQSVTLAAADPTDPTIYTFYLDNTGTFGAIRGTPDPDPVETLPDAGTQLYRGFVVVNAGATTPAVTQTVIYDENLGPTSEWTGQSVGGTTNFGGVTNPFNGTKTTDIGAFTTGKTVTYVDFTNFQTTSYNTLKMYIRLKAAFANNTNINLQFLNGSTVVNTVPVTLGATHGFSKSIVGSYQNISVLLSAFTFTSNTVDRLRITFTGSNASGLYMDYVQLQAGTNNSGGGGPWEPVITPANLTGRYWNGYKQFVRLNSDSVLEGSTNLFFTGPRAVSALSGQNISIFNNNSLYQTSTNLHDSLDIVNARIDSLAAIQDTTWVGTGVGSGVPIFVTHNIALDRDSILIDTTTSITGLATKAFVLNNAGGGGTVTTVTGTSPIVSSGGTTPAISLNTVPETKGGTNQTTYSTGDIIYASASNTLSKLAIGTTAQRLAVVGGVPVWRDTALLVSYNFSGQRDNDLLKYDSTNNRWINFRLNVNAPLAWNYSTNTLSADTTTAITGLATKAYVLNNAGGGSGWGLTGNAGITAVTNFLGTTDAKSLRFRANNTEAMMIDSFSRNVYVGTTNRIFPAKLKVVSNATGTTYTTAFFKAYGTDSSGVWINYDTVNHVGYMGVVKEGVSDYNLGLAPSGTAQVSIGTTTFSDKLRVNGTLRTGTGTGSPTFTTTGIVNTWAGRATIENHNSTGGYDSYWMADANGDATGGILGMQSNHDFSFRTNARTRIIVKNTGYIGLLGASSGAGTAIGPAATPTATLQFVQGTEIASSAPIKYSYVSLATTSTSGNGVNTLTIGYAAQTFPPFIIGAKVTVAGVTPSGYNGDWTVVTCTTTAVTLGSSATTGAQTVAGTITQGDHLLTTPEIGAKEFDGTNEYITASNATRYTMFKGLANSATLDFGSTLTLTSADLTITVTGAALNDAVVLGVPNGSVNANTNYSAWVSATNTVTVRLNNYSVASVDPASGVFKVKVIKD